MHAGILSALLSVHFVQLVLHYIYELIMNIAFTSENYNIYRSWWLM